MKKTINWLFMLFLLGISWTHAQNKTITGTVTDQDGQPLPGVNIVVEGTTNGTQTDFDGNYSINAEEGQILLFSYIGQKEQKRTIGASDTINVQMVEDAEALEEVVVTGVASGTSKKKVGVAVNSVKAEDLQENGAQSLDQALQGKIAGTVIQSTSGQPGQQQNIVLRAINSINSSQPMIMIDGVEVLSSQSSQGGASNLSSRLADIDFTNIERVETISGAAAGTIYGAQGANGVINIITKKGRIGKAKVSIRSNVGVSNVIADDAFRRSRFHKYSVDGEGFITTTDGTRVTDFNDSGQYLQADTDEVDVNGTGLGAEGINDRPFAEETFDAIDLIFSDAFNFTYGASVSGGSDKISYAVSGNRTNQESVLIDGEYVKYDARINLGIDLSDKLKINTRFDVINSTNTTGTNTDNANNNNLINGTFQSLPYIDFNRTNTDGDLVVTPDLTDANSSNPFFFRNIQVREDRISRYIANLNIDYKPWEVLSLNAKYGYDTYTQNFRFFQENRSDHEQSSDIGGSVNGRINLITSQEYFQNLLASANLNFNFKEDLNVDIDLNSATTFTFDWRDRLFSQNSVSGTDNPFGQFGDFNINQSATKTFNGFAAQPFRTYGFLINQKFDFGSLFGFSAGLRRDFSNRFGSGQDFTFPRADIYFNIADLGEGDFFRLFKLRAAYGEAGIQPPFGQNLLTLSGLTAGNEVGFAFPSTIANENLKVETSREIEIGLDYDFRLGSETWFSRIYGSANYFDRETNDVIFFTETPPSSGSGQGFDNAYDITSDGFEFSLDTNIYNNDNFGWNFGARFSKSKAILARTKTGLPLVISDNFVLEEGQEIGSFSVFKVLESLDETDLEGNAIIATADRNNFTIVPESGYVVNKNSGQVVLTPDKRTLGSSQPDFVMTFLNDFRYKDFLKLSVQFDWFKGLDVYTRGRQWMYQSGLQVHPDTSVPVSIEDPTGTVQTGAFVAYYNSLYNVNTPVSHFIEDASFWRMRNISLTINVNNVAKLDFLDNLDVTISGRNLLTFTKYEGLDPEAARNFGNTFQRGFDEFTHPNTKSINFGMNITF